MQKNQPLHELSLHLYLQRAVDSYVLHSFVCVCAFCHSPASVRDCEKEKENFYARLVRALNIEPSAPCIPHHEQRSNGTPPDASTEGNRTEKIVASTQEKGEEEISTALSDPQDDASSRDTHATTSEGSESGLEEHKTSGKGRRTGPGAVKPTAKASVRQKRGAKIFARKLLAKARGLLRKRRVKR